MVNGFRINFLETGGMNLFFGDPLEQFFFSGEGANDFLCVFFTMPPPDDKWSIPYTMVPFLLLQEMASIEDLLTCSICFNTYDEVHVIPHLLHCSHTVCAICLHKLVDTSENERAIKCPICYTECDVKYNRHGMLQFAQNRYLLAYLRQQRLLRTGDTGNNMNTCCSVPAWLFINRWLIWMNLDTGSRTAKRISLEKLLSCPVCCYMYDCDEFVPRLLPCTHTICNACLQHQIYQSESDAYFKCPQCKHECNLRPNEAPTTKQFVQNRYLLPHIEKQLSAKPDIDLEETLTKCPEHVDKMLKLFCKGSDCGFAICQTCYIESHEYHPIVDILEIKGDVLEACIAAEKDLVACINRISMMQEKLGKKYKQRSDIMSKHIECINQNIGMVTDIKTHIRKLTHDELFSREMEIVRLLDDIVEKLLKELVDTQMYDYKDICPKHRHSHVRPHQDSSRSSAGSEVKENIIDPGPEQGLLQFSQ